MPVKEGSVKFDLANLREEEEFSLSEGDSSVLSHTFFEDSDVSLSVGTDFKSGTAQFVAKDVKFGATDSRGKYLSTFNASAGVRIDGEVTPFAAVEISHDLSERLELDKGQTAEARVLSGFSSNNPVYILASAGYAQERQNVDDGAIREAKVKIVGGVHDANPLLGIHGEIKYDVPGLNGESPTYLFNAASLATENVHMEAGVGRGFTIRGTPIQAEVGAQYNTTDKQLPEMGESAVGTQGAGAFLRLNVEF